MVCGGLIMNMQRPLSALILKNLMLNALSYEGENLDSEGKNFKMYGYAGTQNDLFRLTEQLALNKGLIESKIKIPSSSWGAHGLNLFELHNTNFNKDEIERLYEVFWILLNQNIISPGMYRNSPDLPFFHITEHGHICIREKEVLPYDFDGYLTKLKSINGIDDWVLFYTTEALRCFNANCNIAATSMIGLAAEKLVLDLVDSLKTHLANNQGNLTLKKNSNIQQPILDSFNRDLEKKWQISHKYNVFLKYMNEVKLSSLVTTKIDSSARNTFYEFIRLTRNEVSHPNEIKKDNTETLLLFISFIKYVTIQTDLQNTLKTTKKN